MDYEKMWNELKTCLQLKKLSYLYKGRTRHILSYEDALTKIDKLEKSKKNYIDMCRELESFLNKRKSYYLDMCLIEYVVAFEKILKIMQQLEKENEDDTEI